MKTNKIRINEATLRNIIKESVKRCLNEMETGSNITYREYFNERLGCMFYTIYVDGSDVGSCINTYPAKVENTLRPYEEWLRENVLDENAEIQWVTPGTLFDYDDDEMW